MPVIRIGKKLLKIVWICLGVVLTLLIAFHFWFVYHAEEIIQDMVETRSNGRLKLEVEKFRFNWFTKRMELRHAVFYSTDTTTAGTAYRFEVKNIRVRAKAIWPLVFEDKVLINELILLEPDITVTRLRTSNDSSKGDNVSVTNEMGRIYNSIQDALQVLQVKKFNLENASFTLVNKIKPEQQPVVINYIDLGIDNLTVDTARLTGKEKIFFSDNVFARSRNQDILFPDGRHRLSFRHFRINIEKKMVEFDSCTIAALKTDKQPTGFSIFFDRLQMTNIDFDTLYHAEMIKADSVYCVNPHFSLTADLDQRKKESENRQRLDEIIRKLTGDLQLNFVVVNNASFDINTVRNGQPSSFTSQHNNFEMQGLHIDNDATKPLRVERFAMAVRNYENFLRDSLYSLQFDSIHVNNDKIYLNNFSFQHLEKGRPVNSFNVPRFQLTGLSWDDLLFERKLKAAEATLFNPEISYTEPAARNRRQTKRNVFDILAEMNEVLMLEDMNVINGNIKLRLSGGMAMELHRATMSVESRDLLVANKLSGIRRSVNYLDFDEGVFRFNDFTVKLDSTNYSGITSRFNAASVSVSNDTGTFRANARGVGMNEIFINEATGDISIGGISWQNADVHLLMQALSEPPAGASFISLTDINGKNTRLNSMIGGKRTTALLETIKAKAFLLKPGAKPVIAEASLAGKAVAVKDSASSLSIESFGFNDGAYSWVNNASYAGKRNGDSTVVRVPSLTFIPQIQSLIEGKIIAGNINFLRPVIAIHTGNNNTAAPAFFFPEGKMDKIVIREPVINYSKKKQDRNTRWNWDGSNSSNNSIVLMDVATDSTTLSAKQLYLSLQHFSMENAQGRSFTTGKGEVTGLLQDFSLSKKLGQPVYWQGSVASLEGNNLEAESIGKNNGTLRLNTVALKDFTINSNTIKNLPDLVSQNKQFRLQQFNGYYATASDRFEWFNASYDKKDFRLLLDSFRYRPVQEQVDFVKTSKFQSDYIRVNTGAVMIGPFDIEKYIRDTVVTAGVVNVADIKFSDFRDNRLPFRHGVIKPLLTDRIKSIPFKISIDSILLHNVTLAYTETEPRKGMQATLNVSNLDLKFNPVRNYNLKETDSLLILASGKLMDSAEVILKVKESYADSLSGFLLTARIGSSAMQILNPVLEPLANVKLRSGFLDSLHMRVNGDEYMAWGEMQMNYRDLKIQLLTRPGKEKPAGKMLNFLVNTFVIKNNNKGKSADVFFIRHRDRSSINYLIKILLSGVNSSIGVKSTKKNLRSWKKQVQRRNLPPFEYD